MQLHFQLRQHRVLLPELCAILATFELNNRWHLIVREPYDYALATCI